MATLLDDGTLDTVVKCDRCGREHRFNFEPSFEDGYETFVDECLTEVDEECDCWRSEHAQ